MERGKTPPLLPIFRSQQQGELLAYLLADPAHEASLTDLAETLDIPLSSVFREIERAESAGIVESRKVGNTRLVRANTESPYFDGLSAVLVRAFGPPWVIGEALGDVAGVDAAYMFGSWAARFTGDEGRRPVGDIDVLVLGEPDRDEVYALVSGAEKRLGRPVQLAIRPRDWLDNGSGNFHATVSQSPLVAVI